MSDEVKDSCGLFGSYNCPDAAEPTRLGLFAIQQRGQESVGIVTGNRERCFSRLRVGLVSEQMSYENCKGLEGCISSGHVRYSTTGGSSQKNIQPLMSEIEGEEIYVSHNGNICNYQELKRRLKGPFTTTTDSELIAHLIARSRKRTIEERIIEACGNLVGAYSLLIMTKDKLIGLRDPLGFRPLVLGKKENSWFLASETPAFSVNGIEYVRDIAPGEMVVFDKNSEKKPKGYSSIIFSHGGNQAQCIFEEVYFKRPDSRNLGKIPRNVWGERFRMGRRLYQEYPVEADIVGSIPDSGNSAAEGFSAESRIPFMSVFIRNHYIGRTFILPHNGARQSNVDIKLAVNEEAVYGKRVVVVDDSIVRGNTMRKKVRALKEAGAREVHLRISCPPVRHGCFYGMDFPTDEELIANQHLVNGEVDVEGIRKYLGADSLGYLSLNGMVRACFPKRRFCTACFDGNYPTPVNKS